MKSISAFAAHVGAVLFTTGLETENEENSLAFVFLL